MADGGHVMYGGHVVCGDRVMYGGPVTYTCSSAEAHAAISTTRAASSASMGATADT